VLTIGVGTCLLVSIILVPAVLTILSRGREPMPAVPFVVGEAGSEYPRLSDPRSVDLDESPDIDAHVVQFLRMNEESAGGDAAYRATG
jgi:hypothetical protein